MVGPLSPAYAANVTVGNHTYHQGSEIAYQSLKSIYFRDASSWCKLQKLDKYFGTENVGFEARRRGYDTTSFYRVLADPTFFDASFPLARWGTTRDLLRLTVELNKFSTDPWLAKALCNTGALRLQYAHSDPHWGTGYSMDESGRPLQLSPPPISIASPGDNKLGTILEMVRSYLMHQPTPRVLLLGDQFADCIAHPDLIIAPLHDASIESLTPLAPALIPRFIQRVFLQMGSNDLKVANHVEPGINKYRDLIGTLLCLHPYIEITCLTLPQYQKYLPEYAPSFLTSIFRFNQRMLDTFPTMGVKVVDVNKQFSPLALEEDDRYGLTPVGRVSMLELLGLEPANDYIIETTKNDDSILDTTRSRYYRQSTMDLNFTADNVIADCEEAIFQPPRYSTPKLDSPPSPLEDVSMLELQVLDEVSEGTRSPSPAMDPLRTPSPPVERNLRMRQFRRELEYSGCSTAPRRPLASNPPGPQLSQSKEDLEASPSSSGRDEERPGSAPSKVDAPPTSSSTVASSSQATLTGSFATVASSSQATFTSDPAKKAYCHRRPPRTCLPPATAAASTSGPPLSQHYASPRI